MARGTSRASVEDFDEDSENADEAEGSPQLRSFWSGTLTFGLVSIPVNLYTAYRTLGASLRTLAPDGTPLARRYVCSKDGERVEAEDIVRGYPLEKERYVVVTDEELQALEPRRSRDIELTRFVDASSIPPSYFERAYFLAPGSEATRAYHLLASTMERMGKVGIATFVMRGKQHLLAIFSQAGVLLAETMRFAEEVRSHEEAGLTGAQSVSKNSVTRFSRVIRQHSASRLDRAELGDDYWDRLRALVDQKLAKGKDVVRTPLADEATSERPDSNVIDIMEALKRRLAGQTEDEPERAARPRTRSSPRKRTKTATRAAKKTRANTPKKASKKARARK